MEFKFFKLSEFECPCCKENRIKGAFVHRLDAAREIASILYEGDLGFGVESGYRCPMHNKNVGGKTDSAHLTGYAADIRSLDSRKRSCILQALIRVGFTRIGINRTTIHVDMAEYVNPDIYVSNVVWHYYK